MTSQRVRHAFFFSDVHIGWVPADAHHDHLLNHLDSAVDDAELVVLNGDIIDHYRGCSTARQRDTIARLAEMVASWRAEGRTVVYLEGNHDCVPLATGALVPERWSYDFEGHAGQRIRVLHGHKFTADDRPRGPYEQYGRHFIRFENRLYSRSSLLRALYPRSFGWLSNVVGRIEDRVWRPRFCESVRALDERGEVDVLVHGHFHFGAGRMQIGRMTLYRSGPWVSPAHLGTVDRVLRYRDGVFERLALEGDRWRATDDGL